MTSRRPLDQRQAELAKIHLAKKQLGLDDATYRDMLFTLTRKRSAADLDGHERRQVIEHLKTRGFRDRPKRGRLPEDRERMVAKVRALLADAARSDNYGDALAVRMFNVTRYEWLPPEQLRKLIAALVYDQQRRQRRVQ